MDLIQQLQAKTGVWVEKNFGNDNLHATFGGLAEEAGEVLRASVKRSQGIRGTKEEWDAEVRKECADVFIKLCDIANFDGFDLSEAIRMRWADVSQRDWTKDKKGHGIDGS